MVTNAACKDINFEGKPGKYQIGVSWPVVVQILALALAVRPAWPQPPSDNPQPRWGQVRLDSSDRHLLAGFNCPWEVPSKVCREAKMDRAKAHYFLGKNAD